VTHLCLHAHFYQPPRENPWLGEIEVQPSAAPWHDWNERISDECYEPNAQTGTFARLSFNVGPTLMAWFARSRPELLVAIREADREGTRRFDGHGPAIAQAYNHMILPLASERDRRTQIHWGVAEFAHRFGRAPEGLWLPETAVDLASLSIAAELGIRFTILAPHQADEPGAIDPRRPYRVNLPGGRSIAVFFYDGGLAGEVAFGNALASPERFRDFLFAAAAEAAAGGERNRFGRAEGTTLSTGGGGEPEGPPLVHLATDGETFGHHKPHGAAALAGALTAIEASPDHELTVYGAYLDRFPPQRDVRIAENTSWSCPHGVERWRSACGCAGGREPDWSQEWREPLREALDWLRDETARLFTERAARFFSDPWAARDDYITLLLDSGDENVGRFLAGHALPGRDPDDARPGLPLLELEHQAMLMYTSCGWFFDDPGDIETVQILQYAGRVVQLAAAHLGADLETGFLERLDRVVSNDPKRGTGRTIWETRVRPHLEKHPERARTPYQTGTGSERRPRNEADL